MTAKSDDRALELADVLGSDKRARHVNYDWMEPARQVRIHVDQDEARKLSAAEDHSSPVAAAARLESGPVVRRSRLQIHRGRPGNIVTSSVYERLSPLMREDGQLRGDTYAQAQADLIVQVDPQADRRVTVGFVPELKYGMTGLPIVFPSSITPPPPKSLSRPAEMIWNEFGFTGLGAPPAGGTGSAA